MVLAYSSTSSDMWESIAANSFLEALGDSNLALELRKRGVKTLDTAYRDALLLEGFLQASDSTRQVENQGRRARATVQFKAEQSAAETELKAWQNDVVRVQREIQQQLIRQAETQTKQNETMADLLRNKDQPPPPSQLGQNIQTNSGIRSRDGGTRATITCYRCGNHGHMARDCSTVAGTQGQGWQQQNQPPESSRAQNTAPSNRYIVGSRTAFLPAKLGKKKSLVYP